jgi:hypothetical protein
VDRQPGYFSSLLIDRRLRFAVLSTVFHLLAAIKERPAEERQQILDRL